MLNYLKINALQPFKALRVGNHLFRKTVGVRYHVHAHGLAQAVQNIGHYFQLFFDRIQVRHLLK